MKKNKGWRKSRQRYHQELDSHVRREKRRLSRLGVRYNENRPAEDYVKNTNFQVILPRRGREILSLPKHLNFGDAAEVTIDTLNQISRKAIFGDASELIIDKKQLESISPDAAVALTAEIKRCLNYCGSRRIRSNYPVNQKVASLLTDIGYFRYLNVASPSIDKSTAARTYIKVKSGHQSDGRVAGGLIQTFERAIRFDDLAKKRLYGALIECMDNVRQHAYRNDSKEPDLLGEWWMAGFSDNGTGQVAFIFYDQGVGIPTTLRDKIGVNIRSRLGWTEAQMLEFAVKEGLTRTGSDRRGTGLPSLREFIDELSPSGFLRVLSNRGDYMYCKNHRHKRTELDVSLRGSIIVWTIEPDVNVVGPDGVIDLSRETTQLRLRL